MDYYTSSSLISSSPMCTRCSRAATETWSSWCKHEVQVRAEVAEEVLGAAEDGSVKVFAVASSANFQRRNPRLIHTRFPVDGRAREGPCDLPRQLDTDGKPIPKHGDTNEGAGTWPMSTRPGMSCGSSWTRTNSASPSASPLTRGTSPKPDWAAQAGHRHCQRCVIF